MADNTTLNAGTGGDTLRDKDRGGVKTPIVALDLNPAGTETLMAGALPVTGTFWQATQPVSAASLPLPSGASTAAKQPALGIAGTASADVVTVQGIAAMTPIIVTGSGTFAVTQSGTWSVRAQDGAGNALTSLSLGAQRSITVAIVDASGNQVTSFGGSGGTASNFGSTFPTTGTAVGAKDSAGTNMAALNLDASGNLKVNVAAGGASGGTSSSFGSADPGTGTAAGYSDGTNMREARVFDLDSGAGVQYVLGVGLRKVASGGSVEAGTSTDPLRTDPTGTTTQPVSDGGGSLTVDSTGTFAVQSTLQAGTALIGQVSASHETGTVYSGTTALTPKFAVINVSSSGTVVAAVASKRIRVLRWSLSANGNVNIKWQSHVTPTDLTGLRYLTQYASAGGAYCPQGIFQTLSGEALDINLSAAVAVGGELTYVEV